jgi:FAD/FMN-containing dehydrogenase
MLEFLERAAKVGGALFLPSCTPIGRVAEPEGVEVNDVQSQLNATRVSRILTPKSIDEIHAALRDARREGRAVSVGGGRHAMGGQQFGRDTILLDTRQLNQLVSLIKSRDS